MLTSIQFKVLNSCRLNADATQRAISAHTGLSLGTVNTTLKNLAQLGYITAHNTVTPEGMDALQPYKVNNAVIMAAGLSSRFVPLSYEKPKGVLAVRGEVLIERQIKQLQEAGITDITLVVGYKKEAFFYLEELFNINIVVNDEYAKRNNHSSLKKVEDILSNTYICSSDDYFTENPFEDYVYCAYYSAVYEEGPTSEYCLYTQGKDDTIVNVTIGGADSWVMLGHVYWDKAFSNQFIKILNEIYDLPATRDKLWEDIYIEHIGELPMVMRKYEHDSILEFDSLEELQTFDPEYIENIDSQIMDNICEVLACKHKDIKDFKPVKKGLTNLSCRFTVHGKPYMYRHPGPDTAGIINRASEVASEDIAVNLELDPTYIYENPLKGWKITHYLENCTELNYKDENQVKQALSLIKKLHDSSSETAYSFDVYNEAIKIEHMLSAQDLSLFRDYNEVKSLIDEAAHVAANHAPKHCLCHNAFYDQNILVDEDRMAIIDWEYSGMGDYASDIGTFVCCAPHLSYEDALDIIALYFEREPTKEEIIHCIAFVSICSFYWLMWALYKEAQGENTGEDLHSWYKTAKFYAKQACLLAE